MTWWILLNQNKRSFQKVTFSTNMFSVALLLDPVSLTEKNHWYHGCYALLLYVQLTTVWTVDTASLCDSAARSASDHHLSGFLFAELPHSLDKKKKTLQGQDWIFCRLQIHTAKIHWRIISVSNLKTSNKNVTWKLTRFADWSHWCVLP